MSTPSNLPSLLAEFAARQNSYILHDRLPDAVAVKSYWIALKDAPGPLDFDDVGLSVFSQTNEDGILLYIFSRIGFATRRSIEIGCNVDNTTIGIPEGNSINLIVNFVFHGLIVDMDESNIGSIRHFFARCVATRSFCSFGSGGLEDVTPGYYSPVLVPACVAPENVNQIIEANGFAGEVDLLSIDVDGNDVHVWEAVTACSPRVLVIEVNNRLPFEEPHFAGARAAEHLDRRTAAYWRSAGSSLARVVASAEGRGYVFAGMNNTLINAFFVRGDVMKESGLTAAAISDYFNHRLRPRESRVPVVPPESPHE
jgi:hypothetical protein